MPVRPTLLCLALLAPAAAAIPPEPRPAAPRPNVVLIVADDLGYGELGSYGGTEIPTPHLDRLAEEGLRFTQGYVTASVCAPSRAGLLTGRQQTRFGFEGNAIGAVNADPKVGLPASERTLAQHLRATGYATAAIGKWHLGGTAAYHPLRRGFDEFYGFLHEGHSYAQRPWNGGVTWLRRLRLPNGGEGRWTSPDGRTVWTTHMGTQEPDYDADNPLLRGSQPVDEPQHLTDALTREACDFIERHAGQPFFLYVAYNAVHSPLQATDRHLERFQHLPDLHRRMFAALLAQLDEGVGAILTRLHYHGLDANTIVAFLSDNGGATRELTSRNTPLRGEKGSLLEGGIRVPFLVRWPEGLPGGRVETRPVVSLDLAATILAAAGRSPAELGLDGEDLAAVLRQPARERTLHWRMGPRAALRQGDWKLLRDPARGKPAPWQLYHLGRDPGETEDLSAREPALVQELAARWEAWNRTQVEPRW
jgi:arylsulfatase B